MKPKGISLIELHCEKIFLALMALAALGVVAMQFTGDGNTVDVGSNKGLRLDQAYEEVSSEAEAKLGQLEQNRPNTLVPEADVVLDERFAAALGGTPVALAAAPLSAPYRTIGEEGVVSGDDLEVSAVAVGTPAKPRTGIFLGRLRPATEHVLAFETIYGPGPWPRDERAITVETSFDALALRERLMTDPDGDGPKQAAPIGFWRGRHAIAAVVYERQRRLPDGNWSSPETLPPVPGALDLAPLIASASVGDQVAQVLGLIRGERGNEIVRPGFARLASPSTWSPPSFAARLEAGEDPLRLEAEFAALVDRGTNLRDTPAVPLWTHDYSVQPGETYRYRAQVWIPNPYYGFAPALAESSRSLAADPFLAGDVSAWSDPVTAPRSSYWYAFSATDGTENAVVGRPSCRLDVFVFVDGRWHVKQERFEPGDPIRVSIETPEGTRDARTNARVLDVVRAALSEPDARGRQNPMQVVAETPSGLTVREAWRDRASQERRDLLENAESAVPGVGAGDPETSRAVTPRDTDRSRPESDQYDDRR